jgi:mannonate dehydratase
MRLASVLTPPTPEYFELAAQCGVTDFVGRYPQEGPSQLATVKREVNSFGLELSVLEGYLPMESLIVGQDDGTEMAAMKQLIRTMGELEIPILCYNFMAGTDWTRTTLDAPERGGAKVTKFDLKDIDQAVLLGHDSASTHIGPEIDTIDAASLWDNLQRMLDELLPVAEKAGVKLAMHPDDPPLPVFMGKDRIFNSVEKFERFVQHFDSPSNGICFCQGNFAAMGADIPDAIRRLGPHIHYVHFRDVRGTSECFTETFHDNGPTDMVAAMKAYREVGFDGPIRPDHVPQLVGEAEGEPGYTMKGRLFAYGYIRALMQATE